MIAITVLDKGNVPIGPFTQEQITEKMRLGEIASNDLAFVEGLKQWTPLHEVLARLKAAPLSEVGPRGPQPPVYIAPTASAPRPVGYSYAATMQPPPHLEYAGFWPRVAAHILDNLIVSVPFVAVWMVFFTMFMGSTVFMQNFPKNSEAGQAVSVGVMLSFFFLYIAFLVGRLILVWLYHAILESGSHQATWGKRAMGLKVTGKNGERIGFGHASGRYFSSLITGMTMGVGYLMVAFTERKQALHDMIADTLVVKNIESP